MIIFFLLGSGFPIDSKVFLPIITGLPEVIVLNLFKSAESFHGNLLLIPITLFFPIAAINEIIIFKILLFFAKTQNCFSLPSFNTLLHKISNPAFFIMFKVIFGL